MGVTLLDHTKRPMVLTPSGDVFLKDIETALNLIRKAKAEATSGELAEARQLRIGLIDDFDADIAPELAVSLAKAMPSCDFVHATQFSWDILSRLRMHRLDVGVAVRPVEAMDGLRETPLLKDPFVLAVPATFNARPEELLNSASTLPFLRYSRDQVIGTQIESQLRRLGISLPNRFSFESSQSIMAMVAAGAGWTVTTPVSYYRARRFHGQVQLLPFQDKEFARYMSLYSTPECAEPVRQLVESTLRSLIDRYLIRPAHDASPWTKNSLYLLPAD